MSAKDKKGPQPPSLEERKAGLEADNQQRVAQVQQWNQQIAEVQNTIRKMKEDHDYTRGRIDELNNLLGETEQAEPLTTKDAEAPTKE